MIPELEAQYIKDSMRFYRNAVLAASALALLASCTLAHAGERLRAWHVAKTLTYKRHTFYKGK